MATVATKTKIKNKPIAEAVNISEQAAFWGLCSLIFLAPFFRGLFFAQDQRTALIFAVIIFWLTSLVYYQRKDLTFFKNPLDYLILGLPLIYIAATISAANYALAVDEVVENLLYFLVFWSTVRLVHTEKNITNIFLVIYLSAITVSIAGLLTASGYLEIKDGFLTSDGGTIASTFQYKNSLASFLVAALFIGSYLKEELSNTLFKAAAALGNFLLLVVLFSTQSQGGYIVFGIFTVALWFLNPAKKRFNLIFSTVTLTILGIIESKMFLSSIADKNTGLAWLWIIAGIALVALGQWAVGRFFKRAAAIQVSFRQLLIVIVIAIIIGSVALGSMGVFQAIQGKIHMFGAMERFTMYQDGLKMVQEKPVLGWGGGGWSEAYNIFQGYGYTARQTHSYFLQVAIETGLIGLVIAVSIWIVYLTKAFKVYKASFKSIHSQSMAAALICAVLAIISHALIDFDLSLSALTIVMFTLMACLVAVDPGQGPEPQGKKGNQVNTKAGYRLITSTVAATAILAVALTIISSTNSTSAAVEEIKTGNGRKAVALIDKAISMNPLVSENYGIASQLQGALGKPDKAIEYAEKAVETARYNPDRQSELAIVYLRAGQNEKAVSAVRKAIELAPLRVTYYELLSNVLTVAATNELKAGNNNAAANYITQTLSIPENINSVLNSVQPDKKKLWIYATPLTVTDKIKLNIGVANLLAGNLDQAVSNINEAAQNPQVQKDSLVWQALLAQKQGNLAKAQEILQAAEKDNPYINKQFAELSSLKLLTK